MDNIHFKNNGELVEVYNEDKFLGLNKSFEGKYGNN